MTVIAIKSSKPSRCKKCVYRHRESCLDIPCSTEQRQFTGDVYFIDDLALSKSQRQALEQFTHLTYRVMLGDEGMSPTIKSLIKKEFLVQEGPRLHISDLGRRALTLQQPD